MGVFAWRCLTVSSIVDFVNYSCLECFLFGSGNRGEGRRCYWERDLWVNRLCTQKVPSRPFCVQSLILHIKDPFLLFSRDPAPRVDVCFRGTVQSRDYVWFSPWVSLQPRERLSSVELPITPHIAS